MIGDKLIIEQYHTERAVEICDVLADRLRARRKWAISVAGESGAGKSELAYEIYRLLNESGIRAGVLQQDDYFVFPPRTNHEMRRRNLEQVGPIRGQARLSRLEPAVLQARGEPNLQTSGHL